jgi:hypothetical protein
VVELDRPLVGSDQAIGPTGLDNHAAREDLRHVTGGPNDCMVTRPKISRNPGQSQRRTLPMPYGTGRALSPHACAVLLTLAATTAASSANAQSLEDQIKGCLQVKAPAPHKGVKEVRDTAAKCADARAALAQKASKTIATDAEDAQVEAAAVKALGANEQSKTQELPSYSFGNSNWSVTVNALVGLMRVTFGDTKAGTADRFDPLTGLGSGVKFRYSYATADDKIQELIGLTLGLYFEPKLAVSGSDSSAQTLSAMLVVSTFQYFQLGLGWKFASNEPAYDRGFAARNFMLVFGLGADGKSFTN